MKITREQLANLRASHNPWPIRQNRYIPGLIIHWIEGDMINPLSSIDGGGAGSAWAIHDWRGYLCTTRNPELLGTLIRCEAAQRGAVRELITGEPTVHPEPFPELPLDLEDLEC